MNAKTLLLLLVIIFSVPQLAGAQAVQVPYWSESFESTNIPGNSTSYISTPTDVDLSATSGIWKMYYVYRGGTTCEGKPLPLDEE